jgi:hypothetical protein
MLTGQARVRGRVWARAWGPELSRSWNDGVTEVVEQGWGPGFVSGLDTEPECSGGPRLGDQPGRRRMRVETVDGEHKARRD